MLMSTLTISFDAERVVEEAELRATHAVQPIQCRLEKLDDVLFAGPLRTIPGVYRLPVQVEDFGIRLRILA